MHQETFMYGDLSALDAEPEPIITVLLIGWDGRRVELTGTHEVLWNEFMRGDGGGQHNDTNPFATGFQTWTRLDLLNPKAEGQQDY
jgi:hypothetical protein